LGREEEVGRGVDHSGPRKLLPEGNRAVGEVDPDGLRRGQRAGVGRRGRRRVRTGRRGRPGDGREQQEREDPLHLRANEATLQTSTRGSAPSTSAGYSSSGESTSGISSAPTSSLGGFSSPKPGVPPKSRPRLARLAPSPLSPPISCSAASSASRS